MYIATRRAREPPNTAGAFIFSGMIVNHRDTNILEAQLPTPKSLRDRSPRVWRLDAVPISCFLHITVGFPIVNCRYAKWRINSEIEVPVYYRKSYSDVRKTRDRHSIGAPYSRRPISKAFASWRLSFEYVCVQVIYYHS